jgi:hypothetical protein
MGVGVGLGSRLRQLRVWVFRDFGYGAIAFIFREFNEAIAQSNFTCNTWRK